jgi:hypothetical protein
MKLLALLAVLMPCAAFAQLPTCPVAPSDPIPRDAARLTWVRPATYTDGSAIPTSTVFTYTLYERSGTLDTARCTTNGELAGQTALTVGTHTWLVTARVGAGPESVKSNPASKTVDPLPQVPNPPTNLTVTSTRIDAVEWTCRDATGAVLSGHTRQDKAQEACTNLALASLGTPFEIRPSGYRLVAR